MVEKIGKKHYRCHAHTNPFRDQKLEIASNPESLDWSSHFENAQPPTILDIGCGCGRFLFKTAEILTDKNVLGIEIRDKVIEFLNLHTKDMNNCSVIKTNALLFLPNFFAKNSLEKIFVLFPDPHFKKRKQKGRVIC